MINVSWTALKSFIQQKNINVQWVLVDDIYYLFAHDFPMEMTAQISLTSPSNSDQDDFENNYKTDGNKKLSTVDSETGSVLINPKFSPDGWHQQYFETEFETSNSNEDSIHEKNYLNIDLGYSSLKFYKLVEDEEVECEDQEDINSNCIRTDLLWMPNHDYAIKSGWIAQKSIPNQNIYVWVLGADLDEEFGGPQACFAQGGINLTYVDARTYVGLNGVSTTRVNYSHPLLGEGKGTNRLRFVIRHPAGTKHRIQAVFELFLEE